jgi:hypothetical protein
MANIWQKHDKIFLIYFFLDFAGVKTGGFDRQIDGQTRHTQAGFCATR